MKNKKYILGLAACAVAVLGFAGVHRVAFAGNLDGSSGGTVAAGGQCAQTSECVNGLECGPTGTCVTPGDGSVGASCGNPLDAQCANGNCTLLSSGYRLCTATGYSTAKCTMDAGTDDGCNDAAGYQCLNGTCYNPDTNAVEPAAGSPGSSAPSAPIIGAATPGDAQATVTFSAPATNPSAVTGYTVASLPGGGADSNAGSTNLSHVVTGLTNGTPYTFTVTAASAAGSSPASSPSNAVTPAAGTAAGAATTPPVDISQPAAAGTPATASTGGTNCAANGSSTTICNPLPDANLGDFFVRMVSYVLSIIAAVAVAMIVWAGFRMVTMAGNGEATKKALSTIKNAVIGLAITVLAYAAIAIITNVLKGL